MKVKIYNQEGEETGMIDLPDRVFGLKWNADLVHQVITSLQANRRRGTAHAKDRGEVRGGGKKPWRQKGTGRARHGSIRSPIWVGGGVAHCPTKENDFHKKIPKKMAKKALHVALSAKAREGEVIVMDDVSLPEGKTKHAASLFQKLAQHEGLRRLTKGNGVLVATDKKEVQTRRAIRNLPYVGMDEARNLNAYEAMKYKYILFSKSALEIL